MPYRYNREPRTFTNAVRRFFTPVGFLPFVLLCLSLPFLSFDDLLTSNPGYATMRRISDDNHLWAAATIILMSLGLVAWLLRNLGLQAVALALQSGYFLGIAYAIFNTNPHTLGWAMYGSVGLWGGVYVFWLTHNTLAVEHGPIDLTATRGDPAPVADPPVA